jgi:hypothetical protein
LPRRDEVTLQVPFDPTPGLIGENSVVSGPDDHSCQSAASVVRGGHEGVSSSAVHPDVVRAVG